MSTTSTPQTAPPQRWAVMLYSAVAYGLFHLTFLYLVVFVGDLTPGTGAASSLPTVSGPGGGLSLAPAMAINLALIALFGVQHSIMARPRFKAWLTRHLPAAAERATFVLATNLVLITTFIAWQPLPQTLWSVDNSALRSILWAAFATGWAIVLLSSFLINHFELFGLQQAFHHLKRRLAAPAEFRTPLLYRLVRHPLMTGLLIAFWAAPDLSLGRLLFASGMTVYIVIGVAHEEKDLVAAFGERYRDYQRRVPAMIPGLKPRGGAKPRSHQPATS
ncbi:MAG: methanethiol S-methyltransferase [Acidobacteriota bacterium]